MENQNYFSFIIKKLYKKEIHNHEAGAFSSSSSEDSSGFKGSGGISVSSG
jgi:hypothetical protein